MTTEPDVNAESAVTPESAVTTESAAPVLLTPLQARVVSVLYEKEHTVPDTYPLSINALMSGCNQKTSRDPVMTISESDVQQTLDELRRRSWVIESSGGRVMRYSHNLKRMLGVPAESVALLVTLMLRGPQTPGELRINCDRLQRFSDLSAMQGFLDELATRPQGPMAVLLPRQPGARESRWMHLLSGPPDEALLHPAPGARGMGGAPAGGSAAAQADEIEALTQRVEQLETELARTAESLRQLRGELGLAP